MPKTLDEKKEQQIMQAARDLFARFGFKKTTIDEISQAAGIAKGTVYLYFKDKKQLLVRIGMHELLESQAALAAELSSERDPAQRLRRIVEQRAKDLYEFVGRFPDALELLPYLQKKEVASQGGELYFAGHVHMLRETLDQGCAEGRFQIRDPAEVVESICFMARAFEPPYKNIETYDEMKRHVDRYTELLLAALAPR